MASLFKIVESVGAESLELARYRAKMEDRARQEEELFMRAPITKKEKQKEKHLKKSRNGLLGLTDNFYDEIKTLPLEDENDGQIPSFSSARGGMGGRHKKRKDQSKLSQYRDRRFTGSQGEFEQGLLASTTVYIGNMSFYTTEEQVAGEIKKIIMGLDKNTKTPCGFVLSYKLHSSYF